MKPWTIVCCLLVGVLILACSSEQPIEPTLDNQIDSDDAELLAQLEQRFNATDLTLSHGKVVRLPAGSVDGLAGAIAEAGPGGLVKVEAGLHTESGTVTITHSIRIIGDPGAIMVVNTVPLPPASELQPALHLKDAPNSIIRRLDIRPSAGEGGTAILVEDSPNAFIAANIINAHQMGIILHEADNTVVYKNTVAVASSLIPTPLGAHGIIVINGEDVRIVKNDVSGGLFGIWPCDRDGVALKNTLHGNVYGLILCKVPLAIPLPGGEVVGSEESSTDWKVKSNNSFGNFDTGYLVIDGANNNLLKNNNASANARYDMELTGDSMRFGFLTPKSFENTVITGAFKNLLIKDCGDDNVIRGRHNLVDNTTDPCF